MSQTATREQEQTEPTTGDGDRTVWHNPLTLADLVAGMSRKPFNAMCGQRCHPGTRHGVRHVANLAPIKRCQVCADLVAGGQRIAL